jgi:hypothetical protein
MNMIEKTIQDLTAAITALTAAINSRGVPEQPVAEIESEPDQPVEPARATRAKAKAEPVAAEQPVTPAPELVLPPPADAAEPVTTGPVTQADLRDAASKLLAQKRLPDILRINKEHGIRRITECPEEKYEAVFASLNAALADASKP